MLPLFAYENRIQILLKVFLKLLLCHFSSVHKACCSDKKSDQCYVPCLYRSMLAANFSPCYLLDRNC